MNLKILIFYLLIFSFAGSVLHSQTLSWRAVPNSPLSSSRFEDMFFLNENTGWIVHYDGRTFRTTNGGINWILSQNIPLNRSVGFFNSQEGILGTLDSSKPLFRTTNGGINWIQITNLPNPSPKGICGISIVNETTATVSGTYYGFARAYKTTDKGISWNIIFNDTSKARSLIDNYFWSPDSGLIAGGYNISSFENGNAVVLMTTNGGVSWNTVHSTARTGEWCWKINFYSSAGGVISIERNSGLSYFLKTTNGGLNWTEKPFLNYDQEGIGFLNENTGWIGGWTGPTYRTTNGGSNWSLAGWGMNVNRFRFLSDTLAYAVGDRVYKYSRNPVGINIVSSEIPANFELDQNFPNPFNPVTVISYKISEVAFVRLTVYDILGNEISGLVNEKQNPGSYSAVFDGSNSAAGVYFYKLEADGFSDIKKMVLIK
ncbi:MAG: T9SS type A sorting domain-containing protein [Bacteroidetes bacterium]|nr:T9SS type A sorting domain-containing protein [Bacteroidota bacterium]